MCSDIPIVRLASAADARLLSELGERTFRDTFAAYNSESDMSAYLAKSFSAGLQAAEIADPRSVFLIAEWDGAAIGYARLRMGGAPECIVGESPVEIVRFYADAPWIGRGVGASLMRSCLQQARLLGCDAVWLDVWSRNTRAIAFYERWGFSVVGEQDFVLGDDVQRDLLMARGAGVQPQDEAG